MRFKYNNVPEEKCKNSFTKSAITPVFILILCRYSAHPPPWDTSTGFSLTLDPLYTLHLYTHVSCLTPHTCHVQVEPKSPTTCCCAMLLFRSPFEVPLRKSVRSSSSSIGVWFYLFLSCCPGFVRGSNPGPFVSQSSYLPLYHNGSLFMFFCESILSTTLQLYVH